METRRGSVFATNQPQVLHPKAPDEAPRQDVEATSPRDSRLLRKSRRCGELLRVRGSGSEGGDGGYQRKVKTKLFRRSPCIISSRRYPPRVSDRRKRELPVRCTLTTAAGLSTSYPIPASFSFSLASSLSQARTSVV